MTETNKQSLEEQLTQIELAANQVSDKPEREKIQKQIDELRGKYKSAPLSKEGLLTVRISPIFIDRDIPEVKIQQADVLPGIRVFPEIKHRFFWYSCSERLPYGNYEVTVSYNYQTNLKRITVKDTKSSLKFNFYKGK